MTRFGVRYFDMARILAREGLQFVAVGWMPIDRPFEPLRFGGVHHGIAANGHGVY